MEVANFLGKLKGTDQNDSKKFLALLLTDEVVQSAVWHVIDDQTEVLAIGTPVEWDGDTGTTSELITAVDATISSAVEGLDVDPNEVILGIPHSWTDKGGVLGVKKEFINKIRSELELKALGYVEITSSILSYLKLQEGTPTTSILIQVTAQELTIVLVKLGRIEAIEVLGRGEDIVGDVIEGIARFKVADNLPSRIILFNSMHNLDDLIQNLLSAEWPPEFTFLHTPKIESLPKDIAIRALSVAGGAEVAKSLGIAITQSPRPSEPQQDLDESTADEPDQVSVETEELLTPQEIGFTDEEIEPEDQTSPDPKPTVKTNSLKRTLPKLKMPTITIPKIHFNFGSITSKPKILAILAGLIGFALLIYYLVWVIPSGVVTVQVVPKTLDETIELTLSTTQDSINFADRIVPASLELVSDSGEQMVETTGTKIVGDPSTGEVTLYNRTTSNKTFTKGTQLISSSGLKFSLDDDVTIASKSAGSDYVDVPGKANVKISADAIGKDGNLPPNTEFTVASFGKDSYVAKNEAELSGGTSEEVRVVSKEDQTKLLSELTETVLSSITAQATQTSEEGVGVYVLPGTGEVDEVTFSAKVGEASQSLSASLTLQTSLLKYQIEDVTTLVNSSIDQAVPAGYIRADLPSTVELTAMDQGGDGKEISGTAKVQVSLLPTIDNTSLKQLIKGKKINSLEDLLRSRVIGYVGAIVELNPSWIPARLKSIPLNSDRITILIAPKL